jgi:uncharacterized protein YycO
MKMRALLTIGLAIFLISSFKVTSLKTQSVNLTENKAKYSPNQFKQPPYELLEPGDIIIYFIDYILDNNNVLQRRWGHCRLFIEYNFTTKKYIFIEATSTVLETEITERELVHFAILFRYEKILIVKVNATQEQKQNAISFAKLQVGKEFDHNYRRINKNHNTSQTYNIDANEWYCSELVWAAYYNCNNSFDKAKSPEENIFGQGIDIDNNGWTKDIKDLKGNTHSFVSPVDILEDDDTQILEIWQRTLYNILYFRINWYIEKIKSIINN